MDADSAQWSWKDLIAGMFYYTGAVGAVRELGRKLRAQGDIERTTPVFVVHRLGERDDDFFPSLSVAAFENLVRVLTAHYQLIPFDEMARRLASGTVEPAQACLTFDDGYRVTHRLAEPILRRHGAIATTFVSTCGLAGDTLYFDRIAQALERTAVRFVSSPDQRSVLPLTSQAERLLALKAYKAALRTQTHARRQAVVRRLYHELRVNAEEHALPAQLLSRRELEHIATAASDVWHVGSHTIDHVSLDVEPEPSARHQLTESRRALEDIVQRDVGTFCYPHGDFAASTHALVKAAGYRVAATAIVGGNLAGTDPYRVQRTTAYWPSQARAAIGVEREFYRPPARQAGDPGEAPSSWYLRFAARGPRTPLLTR